MTDKDDITKVKVKLNNQSDQNDAANADAENSASNETANVAANDTANDTAKENINAADSTVNEATNSPTADATNEEEDGERNSRKIRIGMVKSDKMDKTITVTVENFVRHKLYNKAVKRTKVFKVHDEKNECQIGDKVKIMETRPLSKDKRFRLVEIIEKVK